MKVTLPGRIDGYKATHFLQNRPGTQFISSYIEARECKTKNWKEVVNSGIQYFLQEYMSEPFFTKDNIARMEKRMKLYGVSGYNVDSAKYILEKYNGYLPLRIQALPEGMVVPLGTPMVQVTNTDKAAAPWVPYIETPLLRAIWYPSTVATLSFHIKRVIRDYMLKTAGHTEGLDFKLHDFGA